MGKATCPKIISLSLTILVSTILATLTTSCVSEENPGDKIIVAVSILPQAGFIEAIGGDKVEVVVMVPPGSSPHTYEVTPDQRTRLSNAKMYAKVGSPIEFELTWLDKLIDINRSMEVVDCAKGIELMEMVEDEHEHEGDSEHQHEGLDPHIWLSVKNVMIMVQNICDGLVLVDAGNKSYYQANCADYLKKLADLDNDLEEDLSDVSNRNFIVFHPSFGYFARDYGLNQIAVEQEGKEPDADYIIRMIKEAKEFNIKVVFVSPQYNTTSAKSIAKEIGGQVVSIDPLAKDFITNMRAIESAMKQAMQ